MMPVLAQDCLLAKPASWDSRSDFYIHGLIARADMVSRQAAAG
jgi:hypothetical protein